MQESNHRPLKSEVNESGTADRADGRDTTEQPADAKTDSRCHASHSQRTQIGDEASTGIDGRGEDNADDTVLACPECDQAGVRGRKGNNSMRGQPSEHEYACRFCGAAFDEPVERERRGNGSDCRNGLARKLADADSNDVGRPMPDGSGIGQVQITDEYVVDHAVPAEGAEAFVHYGLDSQYHPTGGYWFPHGSQPDAAASGWVSSEEEVPQDELIQYPRDERTPRIVGREGLPEWVRDRVVEDATDGGLSVDEQIATRLRDLADAVEVHGIGSGDIAVDGDEATIVETFDLLGGDR